MLNKQSAHIELIFNQVTAKSLTMQKALMQRLTLFYILSLFLIYDLSVFSAMQLPRHIVSHLEALTNYISVLVKQPTGPYPFH